MGAGGSINEDGVNIALRGMAAGEIPGLDTSTLRPYLLKFLRMRKAGSPAGACYQAAVHQLQRDGVDSDKLRPLEEYLKLDILKNEDGSDSKEDDNDLRSNAKYLAERAGPTAEDLLAAFDMPEEELRRSLQDTKTNAHYGIAPADQAAINKFLANNLDCSKEEVLERAKSAGITGVKNLKVLKMHLDSRAHLSQSKPEGGTGNYDAK
jgi:hypothetical protein